MIKGMMIQPHGDQIHTWERINLSLHRKFSAEKTIQVGVPTGNLKIQFLLRNPEAKDLMRNRLARDSTGIKMEPRKWYYSPACIPDAPWGMSSSHKSIQNQQQQNMNDASVGTLDDINEDRIMVDKKLSYAGRPSVISSNNYQSPTKSQIRVSTTVGKSPPNRLQNQGALQKAFSRQKQAAKTTYQNHERAFEFNILQNAALQAGTPHQRPYHIPYGMSHNYGRFMQTGGTDTSKAFLDQIGPPDYQQMFGPDKFPPSHGSPLSFKAMHTSTAAERQRMKAMNQQAFIQGMKLSPAQRQSFNPPPSTLKLVKDAYQLQASSLSDVQPTLSHSSSSKQLKHNGNTLAKNNLKSPHNNLSPINVVLCSQGPLYLKPGIINQKAIAQTYLSTASHNTSVHNSQTNDSMESKQNRDTMLPFQQRLFLNHVVKKRQLLNKQLNRTSQNSMPGEALLQGSPIQIKQAASGKKKSNRDIAAIYSLPQSPREGQRLSKYGASTNRAQINNINNESPFKNGMKPLIEETPGDILNSFRVLSTSRRQVAAMQQSRALAATLRQQEQLIHTPTLVEQQQNQQSSSVLLQNSIILGQITHISVIQWQRHIILEKRRRNYKNRHIIRFYQDV